MAGDKPATEPPAGAEKHNGEGEAGHPTPPRHGRTGHGAASVVPHLNRQQEINDKPAPDRSTEDDLPQPHRGSG